MPMNLKLDRDALRRMLIQEERLCLKLYRCSRGFNTIGVGRNLDANGISEAEARFMLDNDIDGVIDSLDRTLPWWRDLDEVRQRVLADMCFNMGVGTLGLFKNTLADVRDGRYAMAAMRMAKSDWAEQVGSRAAKLIQMMRTGKDPA